ncbi:hypothetical protein [Thauera sinica]|uniref:Uncharacterized protein n=1 Tax=Thauera sinica TaxID=2665146 RepID=A0ABW1AQ55_9RHOO|nr:hypothetical protein [Thauera sp. K11]
MLIGAGAGVSEEAVRAAFARIAPVEWVIIVRDGNPELPLILVAADVSHIGVYDVLVRADGLSLAGKRVRAHAVLR